MLKAFLSDSPYKKQAKFMAMLWTLLILIACFTPSKDIPDVKVPFIDKWAHFILFGGFALLWLCAFPSLKWQRLAIMLFVCIAFGSAIEIMQGILSFLGRSCEFLDAVADTVGGILGIVVFRSLAGMAAKKY